jgi:hypothetical protein
VTFNGLRQAKEGAGTVQGNALTWRRSCTIDSVPITLYPFMCGAIRCAASSIEAQVGEAVGERRSPHRQEGDGRLLDRRSGIGRKPQPSGAHVVPPVPGYRHELLLTVDALL